MLPTGRDLSQPHSELTLRVRSHHRERLDRYLLRRLGWKSRAKIQRLIELGRVVIEGRPGKPSLRIQRGAEIRILLDPGGIDPSLDLAPPIWQDPFLLALNKPPGVLVHPVGRTLKGTVMNALHHRYREIGRRGRRRVVPKLCHRLDRDTSGLLLVAKCDPARRFLQEAFEQDRVHKQYVAVVGGHPAETHFTIDLPILATLDRERPADNRLARVHPEGKPSRTEVTVLGRGPNFSVVLCRPITGRQNQIRAHLAAVGHVLEGDAGYGWEAPETGAGLPLPPRSLLHSWTLEFPHPVWPVRRRLSATPPPDFHPYLVAAGVQMPENERQAILE